MNKETIFSLLRTALTLIGSYLIGKNLLGNTIDNSIIEILVGAGMSLASVVWGIISKGLVIEQIQSFIRSAVVGIGGLLVASGKIEAGKIESLSGFLLAVSTFIYSLLSRKKSQNIVSGKIESDKLKV